MLNASARAGNRAGSEGKQRGNKRGSEGRWDTTATAKNARSTAASMANDDSDNGQGEGGAEVGSHISFALTGLVAYANHLFYRFRTAFRVLYVIRPWYESRVRPISPSDLACQRPRDRYACALVVFVLYSLLFRHSFVIIRLLSFKIHIRDSYEL